METTELSLAAVLKHELNVRTTLALVMQCIEVIENKNIAQHYLHKTVLDMDQSCDK